MTAQIEAEATGPGCLTQAEHRIRYEYIRHRLDRLMPAEKLSYITQSFTNMLSDLANHLVLMYEVPMITETVSAQAIDALSKRIEALEAQRDTTPPEPTNVEQSAIVRTTFTLEAEAILRRTGVKKNKISESSYQDHLEHCSRVLGRRTGHSINRLFKNAEKREADGGGKTPYTTVYDVADYYGFGQLFLEIVKQQQYREREIDDEKEVEPNGPSGPSGYSGPYQQSEVQS